MSQPTQPPWTPSDAVGEALHVLRMSGTFYCRSELSAPWGMSLPATPGCLWFHVVTSGSAVLEVGDETVALAPSDVVLVPRGEGHVLRDAAGSPAPDVRTIPHRWHGDRYAAIHHGGDGPRTTTVCGAVRFEHPMAAPWRSCTPTRPATGRSPAWPTSWRCPARRSRRASPRSSANP